MESRCSWAAWRRSGSNRRMLMADGPLNIVLNFVDGERTVSGIRNALSAEFGPIETAAVARYLEDLVEVEVVRWLDSD